MPRTNALLVKNLYTSGLLEKSKLRPDSGNALELISLVLDIDYLFNDILVNILYKQQYAKFLKENMSGYHLTDEQFIEEWNKLGSPSLFAKKHKQNPRSVMNRRRAVECKTGIKLETFNSQRQDALIKKIEQTPGNVRRGIEIENGRVIVFSDAHFQPGEVTPAYRALLKMIKTFKGDLKALVANGDMFDGSGQVSSHPRMGWAKAPTAKEELDCCIEMMAGIEAAAPKSIPLIWTAGNHDARLTNYIARHAPALEGLPMTELKDFFPMWKSCWAFYVNEDTVIKHRFRGNGFINTKMAGINIVTGHTHQLKIEPWTDLSPNFNMGTRYGVQTGTLADPHSLAFEYCEDNPKDWRPGGVLLSWEKGRLILPEIFQVSGEDEFEFRGQIHKI
jgi:hypothetical protein